MSVLRKFIRNILESNVKEIRRPEHNEPSSYKIHGFHATPCDNAGSIVEKGLIPGFRPPGGQTWSGKYSGTAIYYHLSFPTHEIDNAVTPEGELLNVVFEVKFECSAGQISADEDVGNEIDTLEAIRDKLSVAVSKQCESEEIIAMHVPNTDEAKNWVEENSYEFGDLPIIFHDVDND